MSGYAPSTARATYLASDLGGSVRLATDPTNAVLGAAGYDAWGNARAYAGSNGQALLAGLQGSAPFGVAGQDYDAGPGTYSMRAREYSPQQGRFLSEDPQAPDYQVPVTINPYEYAGNMPTEVTDPSGQDWVALAAAPDRSTDQAIRQAIIGDYIARDPTGLSAADVDVPAGAGSLLGPGHADLLSLSPVLHDGQVYGEVYDLVGDAGSYAHMSGPVVAGDQPGLPALVQVALQHGLSLSLANHCQTFAHLRLEAGRA